MKRYRVKPGSKVDLKEWDPNDRTEFKESKEEGKQMLLPLNQKIDELQELLYAEHRHKVLIVLQAMDTGGKDGTIRNVFEGVNPQGVHIVSFKKPTLDELDRDYLWRVHRHVPGKGEIVVFNRSHYEDVLVVRVHELVPKEVWNQRYEQINNFERMLAEEGTIILKFYLHIDKDEQAQRLQERLDDPQKRWKFNPGDLEERKLWPEYLNAYEDVLSKTSTEWAPWYIVPANRKWYRNLVVATTLIEALEDLNMKFPDAPEEWSKIRIES
ncbi:polyphosphate kinase 2 family protein [candidate division KSB1 bacterium]|nr:polyphosphate kinase 2 family protein [candidate division KSB1 bacterium]